VGAPAQAHFSAPSDERRKLMSAPLSSELRTKYSVRSCVRAWRGVSAAELSLC